MELRQAWFLAGWQTQRDKRKIVRASDQYLAIHRQFVGISVRIDGDTLPALGADNFPETCWNASIRLDEPSDGILQVCDILINLDCSQMLQRVLADHRIL